MGSPGMIRFGGFPLSQLTTMLSAAVGTDGRRSYGAGRQLGVRAALRRGAARAAAARVDVPAADPDAPSLFTALQEQLGLKLESTKGPVDVLVIDSVEQPTPD